MTATTANEYLVFCARYGVKDPAVAAILPACFANAAGKVGMSERGLLSLATYSNQELAAYLIETAAKVAREVA